MSGDKKWVEKGEMNVVRDSFPLIELTFEKLPANVTYDDDVTILEDFMKWFDVDKEGEEYKYVVKQFSDVCEECGSPWCLYKKHATFFDTMFDGLMADNNLSNQQKRYIAYKKAAKEANCGMRSRRRVRLGYCFETITRTTFPSDEYTGFIPSSEVNAETSIDLDDVSVIDLTKYWNFSTIMGRTFVFESFFANIFFNEYLLKYVLDVISFITL